MAAECVIVPNAGTYASSVLAFIDCEAGSLGARGFAALAATGGTGATLLAIALTIFIALIGYRMLLGDAPTVRDGVLAAIKIGVVLAFATAWPAYQTVIYNVALNAPTDVANEVSLSAGLPGGGGGLRGHLDYVDDTMRTLSVYGVGVPPVALDPRQGNGPPPWIGFDTFALAVSRAIVFVTAVGSAALTRLAAGVLLALGPIFFLFLLFAATRGLFEGWLRGLIGAALGAFAISLIVGVELALLEPWLASLLARRAADLDIVGAPGALLAVTMVFAIAVFGSLVLLIKVGAGLRFPDALASVGGGLSAAEHQRDALRMSDRPTATEHVPIESRSRATAIAASVGAAMHREERRGTLAGGERFAVPAASGAGYSGSSVVGSSSGGGARRSRRRVSTLARRRDRR